jgi:hypothetical protein
MAVAVGTADFQWRPKTEAPLPRAMLLAVSVLLVAGLLSQAARFVGLLRSRLVPKAARADLAFAAAWRVGISVLLLIYHAIEHGDARALANARSTIGWWIDLVYCLALVTIVASTRQVAQSWWRWTGPFALLLAWVFSVTCFAVGLFEQARDHSRGAVRQELPSQPTMLLTNAHGDLRGVVSQELLRTHPTLSLTVSWGMLLPVTFGAIYFVARGSRKRWRRIADQLLFGIALTASAAILAIHAPLAWAALLPYAQSPAQFGSLAHFLRVAVPFLLILGTTIAYRWTVREPVEWDAGEDLPAAAPHAHERRFVLLLLAVLLAVDIYLLHWTAADRMLIHAQGASFGYWVGAVFSLESALPLVLTCLVVLHAALGGHWRHASSAALPTRELPWRRFVGVWLAVIATTFLALATMALAGFAYWTSGMMS